MAARLIDHAVDSAVAALDARALAQGLRAARLAGISVGGCARAIGTARPGAFRRQAHAHVSPRDPLRGWICLLSGKAGRLVTPTGRPTTLLVHEYAHLVSSDGHGPRWQRAVALLGAPAEAKRVARRAESRPRKRGL